MATITSFKQQWFANPVWWFTKDPTYDEVITHRFQHLLDTTYNMQDGNHNPLAIILVYDQLPRHILRNTLSNHIIDYYLQKALAVNAISTTTTTYTDTLSAIEWTFFMLPLRHTKEPQCIKQVISYTWQKIDNPSTTHEDLQIYKRFIKATYQRLLIDVPSQLSMMDIYALDDNEINLKSIYEDILAYKGDDVTVIPSPSIQIDMSLFGQLHSSAPIILSLSGGVDSMVCSWLLAKGQEARLKRNVVAVHINYDNRPQCSQEVLFLRDWCRQLGIPLYVRKIDEIHRGPCMIHELRDLYESYTRDVRYGTYRTIQIDHATMPQVVLGHNKDDCLENIMTNICHKNKYDNLYGMQPSSIQDGINFIRPLLSIIKDDIIAFAKVNNIPFLPNSTPTWSQRGQIRNSIVPCLNEWDQRFVPSLFTLTDTLKELHDVLHARVLDMIDGGCIRVDEHDKTYTTQTSLKNLPCETMFWGEFFFELFKVRVSSKSLTNLKTCIERARIKLLEEERRIVITKQITFTIQRVDKEQYVIVSISMKR
jgi:tRNA(Ile)-lysidine synthetase-like protein